MEEALIILGNQLFPPSEIKKIKTKSVFMAEDYGLCTHFKYHKHKIIFFLSSMRTYADRLKKDKFQVTYYDADHSLFKNSFEDKILDFLNLNKSITKLYFYEIEDKFFEQRIVQFCTENGLDFEFISSPMFMTSRKGYQDYLKKVKKPFMKTFYESQRKKFKVLIDESGKPTGGKWSYDQDNRKKLPKDIVFPRQAQAKKTKHSEDVVNFVEKNFKDHPGESDNFWLPTSREESLKWLKHFVEHKLSHFGDYQDSITNASDFVFHSTLAPMINSGLITPQEVIEEVETAYHKNPKAISLNSVEGFIRQVLGWREFVRGIYQNFSEEQDSTNFWNHTNQLNKKWYNGTTGIPVLDDSILKAQKYSYTHHIERLMIISNFMLLTEVDPKEVYRWFMEMHSDSSDWVMGPNVYGMGQFSDGGIFATKPYTCGSNYYLKMSRYKKGDWCETADGLYWRFIDKNKDFYQKNPRMSFMVKTLDRMDEERKKRIFKKAEGFIKSVTTS